MEAYVVAETFCMRGERQRAPKGTPQISNGSTVHVEIGDAARSDVW